jgi:hypothetical protein
LTRSSATSGAGGRSSSLCIRISCQRPRCSAPARSPLSASAVSESGHGDAVQRILIGQPNAPSDFRLAISGVARLARERLERLSERARETVSLGGSPELEIGIAVQIEAVEERPTIRAHSVGETAPRECELEIADVRRHRGGIDAQVRTAKEDSLDAERFSLYGKAISQRVSRFVGLALGPKQSSSLSRDIPRSPTDARIVRIASRRRALQIPSGSPRPATGIRYRRC